MRDYDLRMSEIEDYIDIDASPSSLETIEKEEKYPAKLHARRVASKLGATSGLIYLPGTQTSHLPDSDQDAPFRQLRHFYYLSGVDEPNCFITYDIAEDVLTLYVTLVEPTKAIWFGPGLSIEDAERLYDTDKVQPSSDLPFDLAAYISTRSGLIYLLHPSQKPDLTLHVDVPATNDDIFHPSFSFTHLNSTHGPTTTTIPPTEPPHPQIFNTTSLLPSLNASRVLKTPFELSLLRRASALASTAHKAVLRSLTTLAPRNERSIQALFESTCLTHGSTSQSYHPIAGSGPNASILHYMANNSTLEGKGMVLLDAGPDWKNYASDVTRTFPVTGEWPSEDAKNIYYLVDKMQAAVIERLKPGVRFRDMNRLVLEIMVRGLTDMGVFRDARKGGLAVNGVGKGKEENEKNWIDEVITSGAAKIFLPHGIGHHIGLEVHDVEAAPITGLVTQNHTHTHTHPNNFTSVPPPSTMSTALLEENMVITVEPGIYFSSIALDKLVTEKMEEYIDLKVARRFLPVGGVRIEDVVVITGSGCEVISVAPKGEEALRVIRGEV